MQKIINFTPTGTQPTRENSIAPLTPNEIIEEVQEAYEIGITLVHIHARDEQLHNTYRKDVYAKILEGIKSYCPDLAICVSLTGRLFPEFEKRVEVLDLQPDMGSLTMSSLNFPGGASINQPDMILKLIERMEERGVVPEIECFDSGMLNYVNYLISKGILKGPSYINMIFGNLYNAQCDPATVASILANKPKDAIMCFGGIGKQQINANIMGLMYADGIRIGLEDNLYYRDKKLATNISLLIRIREVMKALNLETVEPKKFLNWGYGNANRLRQE